MFVSPARPKSASPDRNNAFFLSPTTAALASSPLRGDSRLLAASSPPLAGGDRPSGNSTTASRTTSRTSPNSRRAASSKGGGVASATTPTRAGASTAKRPTSPVEADRYATLLRHQAALPSAPPLPPLNLPSTTVVDDLLGQLMELRKELHAARESNGMYHNRIEGMALEIRTAQHELTALRADNARLDKQARFAHDLEKRLTDVTTEAQNATAAWRSEEKDRREVEQTLVEVRSALDRVTRERNVALIDLESARRVAAQANATAGDEVRAARRDRDEKAFSADELRAQLYTIETTHAAQTELARRKYEAELVTARGRIDELQEMLVTLEDRNTELEEALTVEKAAREAAEAERDQAKARYGDAETACEAARRAVEAQSNEAVDAASRREKASEANLARALAKADELSKLCEGLMTKVEEKEVEIGRLEDVNHILAVRLKAAVADSEARSMEAEAREMLTKQNDDMERQLRELRRVVANLMGKRTGAPALAAAASP